MNLKETLLQFRRNEFVQNVASLASGTVLAQFLPIVVSPILTRIFAPQDFGDLSVFLSITIIISSIAGGRYELGILLPKRDKFSFYLFMLTVLLATFLNVLVFLFLLLQRDQVGALLNFNENTDFLLLVPLAALVISIYTSLKYLNIRFKEFWRISLSTIWKAVGLAVLSISLAFVIPGGKALIVAQVTSYFIGNYILFKILHEHFKDQVKEISIRLLKATAFRYIEFPKFSLAGGLFNSMTFNLNKLLISGIFSVSVLGFFELVDRILTAPSGVIGNAIGQVFFQRASKSKNEGVDALTMFVKVASILALIGLPIYLVAFIISKYLFGFIFGAEWEIAGTYAVVLIPFLYIRFIVVPLTVVNNIYETQKFGLIWQFGKFILMLSIFLTAYLFDWSFIRLLVLYSISFSIYYILVFLILRQIASGKLQSIFGK